MSLGEVTTQLQRLATLNEFALAISSAEGVAQLARRVLDHLGLTLPGATRSRCMCPRWTGRACRNFDLEGDAFEGSYGHATAARWRPGSRPGEGVAAKFHGQRCPGRGRASAICLPAAIPRQPSVGALELRGRGWGRTVALRSKHAGCRGQLHGGRRGARAAEVGGDRSARQSLEETVHQLRQAELEASARLRAQQTAESRLLQAAKLVAVGEMAAGVAHELNNPLTTVSGFAELILDETPADAPYRADLEMVLHEAHRARSVVRRLLDFARQGETARARADINEIVEDVLALMTHFIHTSGVQLELELGDELPWITLDGNQMKQVLAEPASQCPARHAGRRAPSGSDATAAKGWRATGSSSTCATTAWEWSRARLGRIFEPFYTTRARKRRHRPGALRDVRDRDGSRRYNRSARVSAAAVPPSRSGCRLKHGSHLRPGGR